jgi:hypothetical protein
MVKGLSTRDVMKEGVERERDENGGDLEEVR